MPSQRTRAPMSQIRPNGLHRASLRSSVIFWTLVMVLPTLLVVIALPGATSLGAGARSPSSSAFGGPLDSPSAAGVPSLPTLGVGTPAVRELSSLPPTFDPGVGTSPLVSSPRVSPTIGVNYQASWDPTAQNEPSIAVNPTNSKDLIVSGNDYDMAATGSSGSWASEFTSLDGGLTWSYHPANMNATFAGGHPCFGGDTNVFFGPDGTAYFAGLGYPSAQTGRCSGPATNGGLFVAHSTDGGITWTFVRVEQDFGSYWVDKEWMGIDPTTGTISIDVMNYSSTSYIDYWYSTNHGATWTGPQHVNPATDQNMVAAGLAVDSSGGVDIVWQGGSTGNNIEFTRATAPGAAFSAERSLGSINCAPAGSSGFPEIGGVDRMNCFPQIFGDTWSGSPYKGNLYVVYTTNTTSLQIMLLVSTNLGSSWSSPVQVNNDPSDGADHWWPQLAVGKNGTVYVEFLDRRYVPGNFYVDTSVAVSTNGGTSFPTNVRVSSVSGNPTVWSAFMGDYEGTFWSPAGDFSVWTDFRNGLPGNTNEDLYVGQLAWLNLSANIPTVVATVDGVSTPLHASEYWTTGTVHNLSVPTSVTVSGTPYTFSHWTGMRSSTLSSLVGVRMNDSSPMVAIYTTTAPSLYVNVTLFPSTSTPSGSRVAVMASVTSAAVPVSGATVTFSDSLSDAFTPTSATTGTNGDAWSNFTAPSVVASTVDAVSGAATATGYAAGSGSATITVTPGALQVSLSTSPSGSAVGGAVVLSIAHVTLFGGTAVAGSSVTFTDSFGDTFSPSTTTTDPAGYAYSNLTSPVVTTVTVDTLNAAATASGHTGGNGTASLTLNPTPTLHVTLSGSPSGAVQGHRVTLDALVTTGGASVSGATVSFADQRGDVFSPASAVTGSSGAAWSNLTLPSTATPLTLTVWANATAPLSIPGSGSTAVVDRPQLAGTASVTPATVTAGRPAQVTVHALSLTNSVAGTTVDLSDSLGGTFAPAVTTTNGAGMAYVNLTVASVSTATSDAISVSVTLTGYAPANLTAVLTVGPAPLLVLNLSASSYTVAAGSALPIHVLVESAGSAVAGVSEAFTSSAGSFNLAGATSPANGTVDLFYAVPALTSSGLVTLTAQGSEAGYTASTGSVHLYVVLPMQVTETAIPHTVASGGTVVVSVVVTDASGLPVTGALVRFSSTMGTLSPALVTTGTNGTVRVVLTAPSVSSSIALDVNATASATGYGNAASTAQVTVHAPPSAAPSSLGGSYLGWLLIAIVVVVGTVGAVAAYLAIRRRSRKDEAPPLYPSSGFVAPPPPPPPPSPGGSSYPSYPSYPSYQPPPS